jgi:hypothetical protein
MTKTGPRALSGSAKAKRQAAVILEVLSGLRSTAEGSQALGVSPSRYYALETRALMGLIGALEARPRGRRKTPEDEVAELRKENDRLERELTRALALVRAAQRSLGVPAPSGGKAKRRKRRSTPSRGERTVAVLRRGSEDPPKKEPGGASSGDGESREKKRGRP